MKTLSYLIAVASLAAGCGNKKDKTEPQPEPVPVENCGEQVAELATWMKAARAEGVHNGLPTRGLELVSVDQPPSALPKVPTVIATRDQMSFNGSPIGFESIASDLGDLLAAERKQVDAVENLPADFPRTHLNVMLDKSTAWSRVVDIATAAKANGYNNLTFALSGKGAVAPPPKSSITAEVMELWNPDASRKATKLAEGMPEVGEGLDRIYKGCEAAMDTLKRMREMKDPAAFDKATVEDIPAAIEKCECKVEIAAVKTLWWSQLGRFGGPPTTTMAIEIGGGDAEKIEQARATPWATAFAKLKDPTKPVLLVAK